MKRIVLVAGIAGAAVAVAIALWQLPLASADRVLDAAAAAQERAGPVEVTTARQEDQVAGGDVPIASSTASTVRQQFREATDYATFIDGVLGDARAGDMDAQYYIHVALSFCDTEFKALFKRRKGSGWLTRDEGLIRATRLRYLPPNYAETVDSKCRKLMEGGRSELGESKKWLEEAAGKGQPIAMAALANAQLLAVPPDQRDEKVLTRARELLKSALKSKDPEVVWTIGELQGVLAGDFEGSDKVYYAWLLAACQRGYECGPQALWVEFSCSFGQCPPGETGVDNLKRLLQSDFPEVEKMAREINANIDAENWSDIDIGG